MTDSRIVQDFYTVTRSLGLEDSKAFGRAMDIAERHPDSVPDIAAVYLRALAELVSEARPETEPSEWAKRKGYYRDA